jgi:hypothetical protein
MTTDLEAKVQRLTAALERALERLNENAAPVAVSKTRAARELDVSTKTIERMTKTGELRTVTVRGMARIPFAELLRVASSPESKREPTRVEKFNARLEAQSIRAARRAR